MKGVSFKIISIMVATVLYFTACGSKPAENTEPAGTQMGVINPMQQYTLEQVWADAGLAVDTDVFTDAVVYKYNLEPTLYQIEFAHSDGNGYCLRIQSAEEMADISGMYYQWTSVVEDEEENCTVSTTNEGQGICLWYDGEYTYCISMDENADSNTLTAMCKVIKSSIKNAK